MKQKIREWFDKRVQSSLWIHQNKKMRVKFRWIYIGFSLAILLLFLSAVVLFYLYGLRFDSQKADPYDNGTNLAYFAAGIVVFIIAVVLAIIIDGIYFPLLYKNSREIYMSSDEYKQQVEKYSEIDLIKFTNRELKWLKKLGWINKIEYQHTINRKHKK